MNHSEKQLAKDLKKSKNVEVDLSLHPQGNNVKLDPKKATNLCEVLTNGISTTYGGISTKVFDKLSKKYSQEAFVKRMAKPKRNQPIVEIENDVTAEELSEGLGSIQ